MSQRPLRVPVHHASQVDPRLHSPALMQILAHGIDDELIAQLTDAAQELVDATVGRSDVFEFIYDTVLYSHVQAAVVRVALAYLERAHDFHFSGSYPWRACNAALGALVVAAKYTGDAPPKNEHWARYADVDPRGVTQAERAMLAALHFNLAITADDLLVDRWPPSGAVPGLDPHRAHSPASESTSAGPTTPETAYQQAPPLLNAQRELRQMFSLQPQQRKNSASCRSAVAAASPVEAQPSAELRQRAPLGWFDASEEEGNWHWVCDDSLEGCLDRAPSWTRQYHIQSQ